MSATPIAVPVQVLWTVASSGQSATVTPATPLQVAVAQVHVGMRGTKGDKGDKGDVGDVTPLLASLAEQATEAKTAAEVAAQDAEAAAEAAAAILAQNPDSMDRLNVFDSTGALVFRVDAENVGHLDGIRSKDGYIKGAVGAVDGAIEGVAMLTVDADGHVVSWQMEFPSVEDETTVTGARLPVTSYEYNEVRDGMYNQWVWPVFGETPTGQLIGGAVGAGVESYYGFVLRGRVGAIQQFPRGRAFAADVGQIRGVAAGLSSDDHNAPATLFDLRPGARSPLLMVQSEHNGYSPRVFSAASLDVSAYVAGPILPVLDSSYSQLFRNPATPDELLLITRSGDSSAAAWMFLTSTDNGLTWSPSRCLSGDDLYIFAKESLDGTKLYIGAHQHPTTGEDQRILLMVFTWATKSITFPGASGVFIADARTSPDLDPFAAAGSFAVYTPAGGRATRLYDLQETVGGTVEMVLADMTTTPVGDAWGTYKHVSVDVASAAATSSDLGDCGVPMEVPAGGNGYFAGAAVHGAGRVVCCKWAPTDHAAHLGTSTMTIHTLAGAWSSTLLVTVANEKLMRPISVPRITYTAGRQYTAVGRWVSYVRGTYQTYRDFQTNIHFQDLP